MNKDIIDKIKQAAKRDVKKRRDPRYLQTMTFLTRKGLLKTNQNFDVHRPRIDANDAVWAGVHVEPRIIEVLPAAILHFPKTFTGLDALPKTLIEILYLIQEDATEGPDFHGIEFNKMKFWANIQLKDKRTKPNQEKRQPRTFRLRPEILKKLELLVKSGKYLNQTHALEVALEKL
jgi:hypothetical protein